VERIGGVKGVTVHETIPSELLFGYRNKMEFSCSDRRWLLPGELGDPDIEKTFALGLHVPGTFDKIIDIDACMLHPPQGNLILDDVRRYMKSSGFPAYGIRSHEGFWRFLMLRHSVAYDQWLVNLITSEDSPEAVMPLAELLMARHDNVAGVVNNVSGKKASISLGDFEKPLVGESSLRERLGPFEFEISANSFFQTNTRGAEKLYETVSRFAELTGNESVVDLYCGTGTIAIWLSRQARSVMGLEIVESAVSDAEANCQRNNIDNCTFIAGDIRESISAVDHRPAVLVIDPPRVGMHKDVLKKVGMLAPKRIVYVSCNPATLARDLFELAGDYVIDEIQPVDMFPHTYHIEAVAKLTRRV
jgi:23S rRNA (uracil1939-C5)-methyltransferase